MGEQGAASIAGVGSCRLGGCVGESTPKFHWAKTAWSTPWPHQGRGGQNHRDEQQQSSNACLIAVGDAIRSHAIAVCFKKRGKSQSRFAASTARGGSCFTAKSPDLSPVELFWGWLRRKLRRMNLADLRAKRAPLDKPSYLLRIKSVIRTYTAQRVAKKFAKRLRSSCKQVVQRSGAAADN